MPLDLLDTGQHWEAPPVDDFDDENESKQSNKETVKEEDDLFADTTGDTGYGTDSLIKAVSALPNQSSNNLFDVILVNVSTIIRNNTTLDRQDKEIRDYVTEDIHRLMNSFAAYQEQMSHLLKDPMIIFYLPDYSWLPILHIRKPSPTKEKVIKITKELIKADNLQTRKQIRDQFMKSEIFELFAGGPTILPYKTILRFFNDLSKLGGINPQQYLRHYLLISHCPLDYHFMLKQPRTTILESFTGKFIKAKQLDVKVFGNNFVPFNSVTHILFGDPVQLKPMAQRKNRKHLMDMAMRDSWYVRTPSEIAKMVGATGQVEARILEHVKL